MVHSSLGDSVHWPVTGLWLLPATGVAYAVYCIFEAVSPSTLSKATVSELSVCVPDIVGVFGAEIQNTTELSRLHVVVLLR